MPKTLSVYIGLTALLLQGCSMPRQPSLNHARTLQAVNAMSQYELPSAANLFNGAYIAQSSTRWWDSFQDPILSQLVQNTLNRNFDIRRAIVDVERAEAIIRGTTAKAGPTGSLFADYSHGTSDLFSSGGNDSDLNLGITSSWDVDLFGATRHTIRSSQANLQANKAVHRDVQRLTIARTVQAYISYRSAQSRIALTKENIERLKTNAGRIERLMQGGYNTKLDLRRSENQIFELQANLASLETQKTAALNALSLTTNLPPQFLMNAVSAPRVEISIPKHIPNINLEHLTCNRPDIRQSQWALLATTHGVEAARAGLYPNLSLSTDMFFNGRDSGSWPQLGPLSGNIIANLAAPLLGRGRLLAAIDQRRADVNQSLINYEETVLTAILDVDNSLSRWQRTNERLAYRKAGLDSAVEAQQLAERLFYAGESDFTASVLAEQSRLQAEDNYLIAKNDVLKAYIDYVAAVVPAW